MEDQIFVLQTEDGEEQQCRVVFSFDSDEHSYVLFSLVGDADTGISGAHLRQREPARSG